MNPRTETGQKLSNLMRDRNLLDSDIAKALDCRQSTVLSWKVGKFLPSAQYLKPLCEKLQYSADDLLGIEIQKPTGVNKALSHRLYKAVTKNGEYNSQQIHKIASIIRKMCGGKVSGLEIWFRELAEVVYQIELTQRPKPLRVQIEIPAEQQLRLI